MKAAALLDTNVVIAAVAEAHEHHRASLALFEGSPAGTFAIAAHSYAEAYAVLSNPAPRSPFRWAAEDAWAALESVAAVTRLIGLTHGQTFTAVRDFAGGDGVGPRLYDRLIGEAAVRNRIGCIVTWNVRHMRVLFPALQVTSPPDHPLA